MKKVFSIFSLFVLAIVVSLQGCGGKLAELKGAEELVETSGKKPNMVSKNIWFEEKNDIKFFLKVNSFKIFKVF